MYLKTSVIKISATKNILVLKVYKKQKDWTNAQDTFKSLLKIAKLGGLKMMKSKFMQVNQ